MKKKLLLKHFLLLFALIAGSTSVWADDPEVIATFDATEYNGGTTNGWTVLNADYATSSKGNYYKLISSDASITTPSINWSEYEDITITITARKYGGPNATQAKISVCQESAELNNYSPTSTDPVSSGALSISPTGTGSLTIACLGASSSKGCGVYSIEVKGTPSSGTPKTPIATIADLPLSELEIGEGTVPLAALLPYVTFAEGKTITDCVPTIASDNTSVLEVSFSGTNLAYNAKKAGEATLTLTLTPIDTENYTAVSKEKTITVVDPNAGDESWVETSLADLTENDVFVIVGDNGSTYAMSNDKGTSSAPTAVSVTVSDNKLTGTIAENIKWNISGNATDGYTFYPNGDDEKWLYCTNTNNGVRVGVGNAKHFTLSSGGYLTTTETTDQRYIGIYNSSDWRCYKNETESNIKDQTFAFYKKVTGDVTTPSISANNVSIAYDATGGSIAFTVNNEVTGGAISASTQDAWINLGNETASPISFTCEANTAATARTATVTLTYTYNTTETVTKTVTITQAAAPAVISTIPDLFAAATTTATDVAVTFNNWVVSGVSTNGKNVFVTDGTNGFVIFDNAGGLGSTYAVGNVLSGTGVSCKLQLYNGFAEITNLNAADLTISTGGTVSAANIAMADLAGINTGALVSYENLTCSVSNNKYYLSDGTTTLQVFNSLFAFDALEDGKTYNITGIYQQYNSTKEILPRSANDIVEVVSTEASIAVEPATVNVDADGGVGTITVTYNNITEVVAEVYFCDDDGEAATYDWVTAEINSDNNVEYLIEANEGEARTAYMMVYAFDDDVNGVYSDLITITQAKYVEATTYSLVTSVTPGKHYIIASGTDGNIYVMGAQKSTNRNAVAITANNGKIAVTPDKQVCEFLIEEDYLDFYTIYDASYNENAGGYLYAAGGTGSNHLKTQTTNNQNGEWAISIDDEGVATIKANMTGRNWMRFNNGNSKLFSCYTDGQQDIYLFERDNDDSPEQTTIAVAPAHEYITFCSTKALDFAHVEGLEAYIVTKVNETSVSTSKVEAAVPARTGLVLKKTVNTASFAVPVVYEATAPEGNLLTGVTEPTLIGNTAATDYILFDGKFYPANQGTLPAGKAYLRVEEGNAPELGLDFSGETTGIVNVNRETITNNQYYTLDGRRVENPTNGIYIINGRKVVVK